VVEEFASDIGVLEAGWWVDFVAGEGGPVLMVLLR